MVKSSVYKLSVLAIALVTVFSIVGVAAPQIVSAFGTGTGVEGDPILIDDCSDLVDLADSTDALTDVTKHYLLTADIDCSANGNNVMIGTDAPFSGVFDGGIHTITVDIELTGENHAGLFRMIDGGTVSNLAVHGSVVSDADYVGMLAGAIYGGTFTSVHSDGTVTTTGSFVGGIAGSAGCDATFAMSSAAADVTGSEYVGGFTGQDACETSGSDYDNINASGLVSGNNYVGGMIGEASRTTILNAAAVNDVSGVNAVGGLVGRYNGNSTNKIFHALASGDVDGTYNLGGLIGEMIDGVVSQAYATGSVTSTAGGDDIGGFIGRAADADDKIRIRNAFASGAVTVSSGEGNASAFIGYSSEVVYMTRVYAIGAVTTELDFGGLSGNGGVGSITNSFWDTETTGASTSCDNGPCGGQGKTTAEMKTQSTFTAANWDFDTIWSIDGGNNEGYPMLTLGGDDIIPNDSTAVGPTETILGTNDFIGGGEAMGWHGDDEEFSYSLPFDFNFYGEDYDSVYVSTNGFVTFGDSDPSYDFSIDDIQDAPLILALGGDLDTECEDTPDEDIYITDIGDGRVVFRWQASVHGECADTNLNFEIVLNSDNSFQIHYGDITGDLSDETRAVGVQDGVQSYVASAYDQADDLDNSNTSSWEAAPALESATLQITSCEELMAADEGNSRRSTIILQQDIDCDETPGVNPLSWTGGFSGSFDGQGYTISNMHMEAEDHAGLFAKVSGAEIQNVVFEQSSAYADQNHAGILAGRVNASNVRNVSAINPGDGDGVTTSNDGYAGGLIGFATNEKPGFDMELSGLSSSYDVYGYEDAGGLIGELENDEGGSITLSNSFATGDVSFMNEDNGINFGGLIGDLENYAEEDGSNTSVVIEDSYATGNVTGPEYAGGLIGDVSTSTEGGEGSTATLDVRRTYATGDVLVLYDYAGGLFGEVDYNNFEGEQTTISNNFAAGSVQIDDGEGYVGGFNGEYAEFFEESTPFVSINNFFDSSSSLPCSGNDPISNCTGIDEAAQPGYFQNNANNAPLNTWDFNNVWIARSNDYPVLHGWDYDDDGTPDAVENNAPNGGDTNQDGIQDSRQAFVTGYVNNVTGKYAALELNQASGCTINRVGSASEASNTAQDAGFNYGLGLMNFRLVCGTNGAVAQVTQHYFEAASTGLTGRKYNPNTNGYFTISGTTTSTATVAGLQVAQLQYSVTDGGILDTDGSADSVINDPAGLGTSTTGAPNTGVL